jgi:hypothetical protein
MSLRENGVLLWEVLSYVFLISEAFSAILALRTRVLVSFFGIDALPTWATATGAQVVFTAVACTYSVIMTPSLAIPPRLAYLSTMVGDFQLPPDWTRSTGVPLPSASYVQ